jgi:hypothetical protein
MFVLHFLKLGIYFLYILELNNLMCLVFSASSSCNLDISRVITSYGLGMCILVCLFVYLQLSYNCNCSTSEEEHEEPDN